jgi:hypothetical protein
MRKRARRNKGGDWQVKAAAGKAAQILCLRVPTGHALYAGWKQMRRIPIKPAFAKSVPRCPTVK